MDIIDIYAKGLFNSLVLIFPIFVEYSINDIKKIIKIQIGILIEYIISDSKFITSHLITNIPKKFNGKFNIEIVKHVYSRQ